MNINYPAVRAYLTAIERNDKLASQLAGAEADAEYDGGEWSGRFHEEQILALEQQILDYVAERYGMTPEALDHHIRESEYRQLDRELYRPTIGKRNLA